MADSSLRTNRERVMRKSKRIVVSVLFLYWAVGLALPARNLAAEPASTSSSAWESLPASEEQGLVQVRVAGGLVTEPIRQHQDHLAHDVANPLSGTESMVSATSSPPQPVTQP